MSVRLFKLLVSSLKQSLPRHPNVSLSGVHLRSITVMELAEPKELPGKSHTRYKRRFERRKWDDKPLETKEDGESDEKKVCERIKRKKMAMLLGYSGVDYYGMQRNPGVPTIEEDLLKALYDAKYITEEDFKNQQNAQFQRSSRTDKGVSAARQVVSLKLPLEVSVEEINNRLPQCIRVFGVKRVTNKFNSKVKCNARTYSYTLPTYAFEPDVVDEEGRKKYRISAEKLTRINEVLGLYKGTKSYHNFTEKKHFHDPSASRYMMSFVVDRLFVESDVEFAVLLVKGQSFMLHQIRKMVGLMIAVVRGHADGGLLQRVFGKDKVMIPTAPGLGLVLDKVHYERYDARFKDSHDSLTWETEDEEVEKFKRDQIYPNIVRGEIEGTNMALWLEKLKRHSYEPSDDVPEDKTEDNVEDDDEDKEDDDDDKVDLQRLDAKINEDGKSGHEGNIKLDSSSNEEKNSEVKQNDVGRTEDVSDRKNDVEIKVDDGESNNDIYIKDN